MYTKWWGMLQIFNSESRDEAKLFPTVISRIKDYLQHRKPKSSSSLSSSSSTTTIENDVPLTKNTIAMVAFMPYMAKGKAKRHIDPTGDKGRTLTAYSLAATLKPLFEANIRRVVIVGLKKNDYLHTRDACEVLKSIAFNDNNDNNNNNKEDGDIIFDNQQPTVIINSSSTNAIATIGYTSSSSSPSIIIDDNKRPMMEVAHVQLTDKNWYEYTHPGSIRTLENVPRGAIIGMQLALSGKMKSKNEQIKWLGERYNNNNNNNNNLVGSESDSNSSLSSEGESDSSSSYWKYVLLTEPDSVLNLNHGLLPLMKDALDEGISFFPHRIHPLPHETDLPNDTTLNRGLYLPNVEPFSNVTTLDPLGDDDEDDNKDEEYIACCDGGNIWPGFEGFKRNPQSKWWENGFRHLNDSSKNNNDNDNDNDNSTHINITAASYNLTKIRKGHRRLLKYKWMRLKDGVGIVFGSNNNGRFCVPSKTMCTNENTDSKNNNDTHDSDK